jgi:hypothetical protein
MNGGTLAMGSWYGQNLRILVVFDPPPVVDEVVDTPEPLVCPTDGTQNRQTFSGFHVKTKCGPDSTVVTAPTVGTQGFYSPLVFKSEEYRSLNSDEADWTDGAANPLRRKGEFKPLQWDDHTHWTEELNDNKFF